MHCLTTAWTLHAAELSGWLRHRVDNPALADDLTAATVDTDPVDTLTVCLPRGLSELSMEDREAITLCDLQGTAQADFARAKGLSLSAAKSCAQRARVRLRAHMSRACLMRIHNIAGRVPHKKGSTMKLLQGVTI